MNSKWSDYLSTAAIRAVAGFVIACAIGVPVLFFLGGRHSPRKSLLVDWINQGNYRAVGLWFGAWGIAGAVIAVVTIPRWQTPWAESVLEEKDDKSDDDRAV